MDRAAAWRLLEEERVATLVTLRADGSPRPVPCVYSLSESTIYTPVDGKPKSTRALARLADIRRDPRVALLVQHWSEKWTELWWIRLEGRATFAAGEELELAREHLLRRYPQYSSPVELDPVVCIGVTSWGGWMAVEERPP